MLQRLKTMMGALRAPSQQELELRYLNGSQDRVDLEYRQREIDRGLFRSPF